MSTERHSRQIRFAPIGADGQARLAAARVAIVGCGALGTVIAEQLARAGVRLRLIDRDFVEDSNLQRQSLFTAADAAAATPKAVAARAHLQAIDADLAHEATVAHLDARNVEELFTGIDLVLDGTDNFATRHVLNEACCRAGLPWIYGACVGAYGLSLPVVPGTTPCLRCVQSEVPLAGDGETCDSVGVIAPIVHLVAGWQVAEALKLLVGDHAALRRELWACDLWQNRFQRLHLADARDPACRSCGPSADHPALHAPTRAPVVLCGRDAIQIPGTRPIDLAALADTLGARVEQHNAYLVRWRDGALRATAFADGRALVQGVGDEHRARSFLDRWLG